LLSMREDIGEKDERGAFYTEKKKERSAANVQETYRVGLGSLLSFREKKETGMVIYPLDGKKEKGDGDTKKSTSLCAAKKETTKPSFSLPAKKKGNHVKGPASRRRQ